MPRLTKSFMEKYIPADNKRLIIRDSELAGFGVRINSKTKSWIIEKRIVGVNRRITIGTYPLMSADEARRQARAILCDISSGVDPIAQKENERIANLTLAQVLDEFLQCRNLKPQTRFMVEERLRIIPGPAR